MYRYRRSFADAALGVIGIALAGAGTAALTLTQSLGGDEEPSPRKESTSRNSASTSVLQSPPVSNKKKKLKKSATNSSDDVKSESELFYMHHLSKRRLYLNGPVSEKSAKVMIGSLMYLNDKDPDRPVFMYINSGGGSVASGLAIYDAMRFIPAPVYTVCMGRCESMAAVLLAAGDKRFSTRNSRVMVHQPKHTIKGMTTEILLKAEKASATRDRISTLLAKHSNRTMKEISEAIDRNTYMAPEEATKFGLIDQVIETIDELADTTTTIKPNTSSNTLSTDSSMTKEELKPDDDVSRDM